MSRPADATPGDTAPGEAAGGTVAPGAAASDGPAMGRAAPGQAASAAPAAAATETAAREAVATQGVAMEEGAAGSAAPEKVATAATAPGEAPTGGKGIAGAEIGGAGTGSAETGGAETGAAGIGHAGTAQAVTGKGAAGEGATREAVPREGAPGAAVAAEAATGRAASGAAAAARRGGDDGAAGGVAILGAGPRGLAALEALGARAGGRGRVTVFEPHPSPGAGPVYDPAQTPLNLLNLPLRAIDLPAADGLPGFREWCGIADPEAFPPRAALGRYLALRFERAAARAGATLVPAAATGLAREGGGWRVAAGGREHGPFAAVLIAVGHQPAGDDPQRAAWRVHAAGTASARLLDCWPSAALVAAAPALAGQVVAIRGFGLSMLDVVRVLSEGLGGRFEPGPAGLVYRPSGREPRLVPFSRDGMPPAAKPATAALDAGFVPPGAARAAFRAALAGSLRGERRGDPAAPVLDALAAAAAGTAAGVGAAAARDWLAREFEDGGAQMRERVAPGRILRDYLAMAEGQAAPSAGYALGQVWRHLQDDLRAAFAPETPDAAARIVAIDEGFKRYSYGPPAAAIRRLAALEDAGVVTLRQVDDPEIALHPRGWRLQEDAAADVAIAMIDAVQPGPDPARVAAPLVAGLIAAGVVAPWGPGLGFAVDAAGGLIGPDGLAVPGLSLVGRLAAGARIGSDSIHDAFGADARAWARAVAAARAG